MDTLRGRGRPAPQYPSAGRGAGARLHRLARASRRAAAALGAAALAGLTLAAGTAESATRLTGSGPVQPFNALSEVNSRLELFTMSSTFTASSSNDPTVVRLTDNGDSDYNPRFSADGRKLVFVKNGGLWTMRMNPADNYRSGLPGSEQPLTAMASQDTFAGGWCRTAGREFVVFQRSTVALSFEIYMVEVGPDRLPAGPEVPLSRNTANDSQPSVLADCSKIAFHSNRAGASGAANSDIWVMPFDPTNLEAPVGAPVNLTDCSQAQESGPSLSPDGSQVAFQSNRLALDNLEIYRIPISGDDCAGSSVRLTYSGPSGSGTGTGLDLTGYDLLPSFSPDGARVCFHSGRSTDYRDSGAAGIIGQWEIYTVGATSGEGPGGKAASRKTNRPGNDERCSWQRTS